jgi:prepilin-type N-terminal cleavage/methylation domain-containing protein
VAGNKSKAFTLIELLVVIAIIALLLSVLIPALKKAKTHAKRLVGQSNLRSLSMAVHIYLNNNNDMFFDYGSGALWMDSIGELVDNIDEIRFCPETIAKKDDVAAAFDGSSSIWGESHRPWLWADSPDPDEDYELGSYGLNGWLYSDSSWVPDDEKNLIYGKRSRVQNPMKTPCLLDANWVDGWPRNTNTLPATYNYEWGDQTSGDATVTTMIGRFVTNRHGPETNVIFLDGQVQTIPLAELWTLAWHRGAEPNFNVQLPQPEPTKN